MVWGAGATFIPRAFGVADVALEATDPVTRIHHEDPSRDVLIRDLWPDKALYASVLLFVTGFVGIVNGIVRMGLGLTYSARVPTVLADYPSQLTVALSVVTVAFAYVALQRKNTNWTVLGAVAAVVSLGFIAINLALALVSLWFVVLSRREEEDRNPATLLLTADMWPDKTLAASLLMLIGGISALVWGTAIAGDLVTYDGYLGPAWLFGSAVALIGVAGIVSARELYFQRGRAFAMVSALLLVASASFWIIGPALGIAGAVLVQLGKAEDEFEDETPTPA